MREPNILLDALIDEVGMSHDGFASRVNQAGLRHGLDLFYDHASVRRWIRDATVPRGRVPELICEVLSMRLGRTVTLPDAGLAPGALEGDGTPLSKAVDAATALWRSDYKHAAPVVRGAYDDATGRDLYRAAGAEIGRSSSMPRPRCAAPAAACHPP